MESWRASFVSTKGGATLTVAIEAGRSVPSTALALRLARALRCGVEDIFQLRTESGLAARLDGFRALPARA